MKKLDLNKEIVARIDNAMMSNVKGGDDPPKPAYTDFYTSPTCGFDVSCATYMTCGQHFCEVSYFC